MLRLSAFIVICFLLTSCANQMAPTGGDKDVTPPAVIEAAPENLSLHFNAKEIKLTFDEFFQLNSPATEIYFSPSLKRNPQYKQRGKSLIIQLNDTLEPNTTYTISFGNAIKDVNEGNVLINFNYVFSTGDFIDSMRIGGNVTDAFTGKPIENVLVMLYPNTNDSVVALERPFYYSRTDKNGAYTIAHVKEGTYKLFALNDADANLLYNQPTEQIAFADSNIFIHDTSAMVNLKMFKPNIEKQKVLYSVCNAPGKISFAFAKPVNHLQVTLLNVVADLETEFNSTKDTCTLWVSELKADSLFFQVSDGDFSDTLKVRLKKPDEKSKSSMPRFTILNPFQKERGITKQNYLGPLNLSFSVPIFKHQLKEMMLAEDSTKQQVGMIVTWNTDSTTNKTQVLLTAPWKQNTKYKLTIVDSTFFDLFNRYNDSTTFTFTTYEEESLGNLLLHVTTDSVHHFYFHFISSDGTLIEQSQLKNGKNDLSFKRLEPGNYSFIVIEDDNQNKKWDSGNYWTKQQPEKVFRYSDNITIRSNWDLELDMIVGQKSVGKK